MAGTRSASPNHNWDIETVEASMKETCTSLDNFMLWAAPCTGFFGFLRAREFTVPSQSLYDPEVHLNLCDVMVDSYTAPLMFSVRVKQSKTDPFRVGVQVYLGATQSDVCPVKELLEYIQVRSTDMGPLFVFQSGKMLSRQNLVRNLHEALVGEGIPASNYKGHSFIIGAATTAAHCGLEDSLIQSLGRWTAYLSYHTLGYQGNNLQQQWHIWRQCRNSINLSLTQGLLP